MSLSRIDSNSIAANAISTADLAESSITSEKIAANAITSAKIESNAITSAKIEANAITSAKIEANAITSAKIEANVTLQFAAGSNTAPSISVDGDSNTGIFFPAADTIAFARNGVEVGRFDSTANANFQFDSGFGSVGIAYGCRAWVNFNGTGTVAIRASGNVSSITDNGTGDYTVNFTTAMPDANYGVNVASSRQPDSGDGVFCQNIATDNSTGLDVPPTTTSIRVSMNRGLGLGGANVTYVCVSIFR